ncbi:lipase chaperone family protein [Pseudoalteromonas sp. MMG022]|uniref:lipase chaperone family protein n=1 Tax=Pseudoalteromonas sp. MMG022 TaxID=2909978 RepID=UPI001F3E375E|nr:lipase chaperone family protein [Pseudoalteromonas sp. MMG022]MCF6436769.1 lipase chaperone [Pseudoalteromonas sp. MMG022]
MSKWGLGAVICLVVGYFYFAGSQTLLSEHTIILHESTLTQTDKTPHHNSIAVEKRVHQRCDPVSKADKNTLDDWLLALQNSNQHHLWRAHLKQLDNCLHDYVETYMAYKQALTEVDENLNIFERHEFLQSIQQRFFSAQVIALWFAQENAWNAQAIERWKILADKQLSEAQKQQLIAQHVSQLPEREQRLINNSTQLHELADSWQKQDYNQLSARFGDEAAERIIALQKERASWQQKLAKFEQERAHILAFELSHDEKTQAIEQLKQSMFSDNEQKRLPNTQASLFVD